MPVPPGPVSVSSRLSRQQCRDLADLPFAAEEGRQPRRQVVRDRVERRDRREVALQIGDHELPEVLGPLEVLEPMLAEVAQLDTLGQRLARRASAWCRTGAPGRRGRRSRCGWRDGRGGRRRPRSPKLASPVCMPIRTRTSAPSGHGSRGERALRRRRRRRRRRARWGRRRRTSRPRSRPRRRPAPRTRRAAAPGGARGSPAMRSPCDWSSRVDPSMSVNRKVTVPVSSSGIWC